MGTPAGHVVEREEATRAEGVGQSAVWLVTGLALAALPLAVLRGLAVNHVFPASTYLPIHALIEIAIALVGLATFAVQWYAAGEGSLREARARFIGVAFLGVAVLHAVHLLVFPGMPGLFGPSTVERGIYYWLIARAWMTGALVLSAFVAPGSEHPLLRRGALLTACALLLTVAVAVELGLPASPGIFYQPGSGLTPAKVAVEWIIALVAAGGAALHYLGWRASGDRGALRISAALGLVALCEICFSLYASAYDVYNLLGHAYALAAAALIFDGLFTVALLEPYHRLGLATRDLAASNARLEALRAHVEGELAATIARLEETTAREQTARGELEAAIAAVPSGILILGADGGIRRMNAAAERLLRYGAATRQESLHERWNRLAPLDPDGKPIAIEQNPSVRALRGETATGVVASMEVRPRQRVWVTIGAAPTRAADGRLDGAVAALTDITALQALQSQREDLLHAVSHDLRNPLQIVLLQAERLERLLNGEGREKERLSAARIALASRQMGEMIRDLVEAARMEGGRLQLAPQRVALRPYLETLLAHHAGALDVARVELDLGLDLPAASADPARLDRIFTNLVGNALKYSPDDTKVHVSAAAHDGALVISVKDRGIGIAQEDLPHVFERFYRGQRTAKSDGLGLGLFIVRLLVEAHGGRAWAESTPGQGSVFSFTLPLAA
jgi:signal transduction histidine kinase